MAEEIFQRKQFTFYESFYHCIEKTLTKKTEKLIAYEALIQYALYGSIAGKENLPPTVSGLLEAFYPFLNTARRKARNYQQVAHAGEFAAKEHNKNKTEIKTETEIETNTETKINTQTETKVVRAGFEWFWSVYPRKIGKEDAYKAFCCVTEPADVLVEAVKRQTESLQWQREGGRYIPNPATWLRNKRWTDCTEVDITPPLSELDRRAIERMMTEGFS